jgi:hypothetical protein
MIPIHDVVFEIFVNDYLERTFDHQIYDDGLLNTLKDDLQTQALGFFLNTWFDDGSLIDLTTFRVNQSLVIRIDAGIHFDFDGYGRILRISADWIYHRPEGRAELVLLPQVNGINMWEIVSNAFGGSVRPLHIGNVIIPEGVTHIRANAFNNNPITHLYLPDSVEYLGTMAFFNNSIYTLTGAYGLEIIGQEAFRQNRITHLYLPNVIEIRHRAFDANRIATVYFGQRLERLNSQTIFVWNYLRSVYLPDSVTHIGGEVFALNRIEYFSIGPNVVNIGLGIFRDTTFDLREITFRGTIAQWNAIPTRHASWHRIRGSGTTAIYLERVIALDGTIYL